MVFDVLVDVGCGCGCGWMETRADCLLLMHYHNEWHGMKKSAKMSGERISVWP